MQNQIFGNQEYHRGPCNKRFLASNKSWESMIVTCGRMVLIPIWEVKIDSAIFDVRFGSWFSSDI